MRHGYDCPAACVAAPAAAVDQFGQAQQRPDLVVVILSPGPEPALAALAALRLRSQARFLAVGPAADPRLVLRALRAGVSDFVDEAELEVELQAALGQLMGGLSAQSEPGKTIAVLGSCGGCGSTTLAANIATVLAKEHRTSLLIDLKLRTGDLASLLDLKPSYTLADLCPNAEQMDRVMLERSLVHHSSGAHLLAAPRVIADASRVTAAGVQQALTLARTLFPYIVVDLDVTFAEEQMAVLRAADLVLLVFRLDFTSLKHTQRVLDHLRDAGVSADRIKVVVNRHGQPKEVPAAKAEAALGRRIHHFVPEEAATVNRANNNGVPVVLESPSAKVSRSLAKLAASVNGRTPTP
jgi:pilus assembly protein CpaE